MLWGDSDIECLLEEHVDGAFDNGEPFFLERKFESSFHMFISLTLTSISGL
jgi:hypothetical protein